MFAKILRRDHGICNSMQTIAKFRDQSRYEARKTVQNGTFAGGAFRSSDAPLEAIIHSNSSRFQRAAGTQYASLPSSFDSMRFAISSRRSASSRRSVDHQFANRK